MKHKLLIIAIIAIIGFSFITCDDSDDSNGGIDPALNGTWVYTASERQRYEVRNNNGSWEESVTFTGANNNYNGPVAKGTYTASGGKYNSTVTHYHGNYLTATNNTFNYDFGSGWLTMNQYYSAWEENYRRSGMPEEQINTFMNSIRNPETYTTTYSVRGNTLTFTNTRVSDGSVFTTTYTKK